MQPEVIGQLRATDLFRSLDDEAATRLARHLVRRRYRRDEVVFHQGDPGDRLHIVESGRIRIGIASEDGREGTLTLLGPGQVFGELVLLDAAPRSATAVALEPTVTATLERSAFRQLMDEDAEIREAVLLGVARWLRRLTDQVSDLHFLDLRGRVCAAIVRLARQEGAEPNGPTELPAITQADLAALASGTRQRVSTILGELADEGLIQYDGKRITVVDVDRLAQSIDGWSG